MAPGELGLRGRQKGRVATSIAAAAASGWKLKTVRRPPPMEYDSMDRNTAGALSGSYLFDTNTPIFARAFWTSVAVASQSRQPAVNGP